MLVEVSLLVVLLCLKFARRVGGRLRRYQGCVRCLVADLVGSPSLPRTRNSRLSASAIAEELANHVSLRLEMKPADAPVWS